MAEKLAKKNAKMKKENDDKRNVNLFKNDMILI
jgi:hypothetical protein